MYIEYVATMCHAGVYFSLSGTHFNVCDIRVYTNVWVYWNNTWFQINEDQTNQFFFDALLDDAVVVAIKSDFCVRMRT